MMDTRSAALSAERPAHPAVVTGLAPHVLMTALEPTTGLALWRRRGRAASRRGAQAAFALAPFCKMAEGPPDHATRELLQDMPAATQPLGADIRLLGRLFTTVTASSTVRFRLEHVVDDACRQHHVDSVRLRLLCTYAGLGTDWIRQGQNAAWPRSMSASSRDQNSRIPHRESCTALRRSSICQNSGAPGFFYASTNQEFSDDRQ